MAPPYTPLYRFTLYAPRSVDATEATVLTPIGGAPHSDNFVVATRQGIAGAKPYLGLPRGKQGSIDVLTKKATIGTLTIPLYDFRTTAGGSNAQRWVTAFLGDTKGKLRLKGCKGVLEESLDGTVGGLVPIFTGRAGDLSLDSKQRYSLELRSIADDMEKRIFVGRPHSSITYAFLPALFPIGLPLSWAAGAFPARPRIQATIGGEPGFPGLSQTGLVVTAGQDPWLSVVTKQSFPLAVFGSASAIAIVRNIGAGTTGAFRISRCNLAPFGNEPPHERLTWLGPLIPVDPADPLYMAVPSNGTAVEFYVIEDVPVSKERPLLVDDVHRIQLWADILDGKFSTLRSDFSARPIAGRAKVPGWSTGDPWKPFIDDASFGTVRMPVYESAAANEWIEKYICQDANLAYRLDGEGKVLPLDLRLTSAVAVTGAIVDADLADGQTPAWRVQGAKAVFGAKVKYYVDRQIPATDLSTSRAEFPDVPLALIESIESELLIVNPDATARDAGDKTVDIDARGLRLTKDEFSAIASNPGQLLTLDKIQKLRARILDLLPPFAGGASTLPLRVRRSSTAGASCYQGSFWTVTVATQPDPSTNQRGGTRLMLCTNRTENGLFVDLEFLDFGANATAAVPTVGTIAAAAGGIDVPITLNAAGDPVRVEFAITPAGTGAHPADTDPSWTLLDTYTANGTRNTGVLPGNTRTWVRARSQPLGRGLKQPSAWVYAASPASIDRAAIAAPSAIAKTNSFGNRVDISWTNGDATKPVEIYLYQGAAAPGTWTESMKLQPVLPPASTTQHITGLTPSTNYTVGVRHRDPVGGTSSMATHSWTTPAGTGAAPAPLGISILAPAQPRRPRFGGVLTPIGAAQTGVAIALWAGDVGYDFEIERANDAAGTGAVTIANDVPGTQEVYVDALPLDGVARWYRVRHVGLGDTPSAWTSPRISGTPIQLPSSLTRPRVPLNLDILPDGASFVRVAGVDSATNKITSSSSTGRNRCRLMNSANQSLTSGVTTALAWDTEDYDVGGLHSTSSNTSRITIPTGGDTGVWIFFGAIEWGSFVGTRTLEIFRNGVSIAALAEETIGAANALIQPVFYAYNAPAVGDYFEIRGLQTTGGAQNVLSTSWLAAVHLW